MMVHGDVVVYAHHDGTTYVALLGEDGQWWRWPAERNGWQQRARCSEAAADGCDELEPRLARLALGLSGVVPPDAHETG